MSEEMQVIEDSASDAPQETVALHEASNEDVKAALAAAQEAEKQQETAGADISPPNDDLNSTQKPIEAEAPQKVAAPVVAPVGTAPSAQAQALPVAPQPELGNQKELLIRTRRSELGQVKAQFSSQRSQLLQVKSQLENGLREVFQQDPYEGFQRQSKLAQVEESLRTIDAQEKRAEHIVESQTLFLAHIGDDPTVIEAAARMMREEGVPEQYVQEFEQDPWSFTAPESLVEIGKRAVLYKKYGEAHKDRVDLAKHVLYLNGELEKAKGRTQKTVAQIQRNLNQSPSVTARGSSGMSKGQPAAVDVTSLSNNDVKTQLARQIALESAQ